MANWYIKLEPLGKDGQTEYFKGWIKHDPKAPVQITQIFKRLGVLPGESYPLWTNDYTEAMFFAYKGMAEKTVEKIEQMIEDFKGHMHVTEALSYEPSEDDRIADGIGQTFSPD